MGWHFSLLALRLLYRALEAAAGCRMWQPDCMLLLLRVDLFSLHLILVMKVRFAILRLSDCLLTENPGGAPIKAWVYRACVIQGTQQIYVVALWYWGSVLTRLTDSGVTDQVPITKTKLMAAITMPIAGLMWAVGLFLFIGLPDYYRQAPGKVPSFYRSLVRRKIIMVSPPFLALFSLLAL